MHVKQFKKNTPQNKIDPRTCVIETETFNSLLFQQATYLDYSNR